MQQGEGSGGFDVADFALRLLPWLVVVAGLLWAVIELRVRKLVDARFEAFTGKDGPLEKAKEDLRREFTTPIGEIGTDAMRALDLATEHESRLKEQETKVELFWGMVERSTANLLRKSKDE